MCIASDRMYRTQIKTDRTITVIKEAIKSESSCMEVANITDTNSSSNIDVTFMDQSENPLDFYDIIYEDIDVDEDISAAPHHPDDASGESTLPATMPDDSPPPAEPPSSTEHGIGSRRQFYEREYECDICGRISYSKASIEAHMEEHSVGKTRSSAVHSCADCGSSFAYQRNLINHRIRHHSNEPVRVYSCEYDDCTKTYLTHHSLRMHMEAKHLSIQRKTLPSSPRLEHMCDVCGAVKASEKQLNSHMYLHQDAKTWPYPCDVCDNRFRNANALREHRNRIHLKIRNFVCKLCEARFASNTELKQHHGNAHKTEPSARQCPHCVKTYASESEYKTPSLACGDLCAGGDGFHMYISVL